jgi:hypothetical protein
MSVRLICWLVLLTACGGRSRAPAPLPPPRDSSVLQEVAELRMVRLRRSIQVLSVSGDRFREAAAKDKRRHEKEPGLVGLKSLSRHGTETSASSELLSGFYDADAGAIWLREDGVPENERKFLEAHEAEHAVQDQRIGLTRFLSSVADDALLARKALVEGDAQLTALAVQFAPAKESLSVIAAELLRANDVFGDWFRGPAGLIANPLASYLYNDGLRFCSALEQAGGFAMIDRVFEHPPISSAQVLHPEKYARGTLPVVVPEPELPKDLVLQSTGTLGEEGLALWLATKRSNDEARDLAAGWSGDRYTVARDHDRTILLLLLVMENKGLAERLFAALSLQDDEDLRVLRDETRVAIVVGAEAKEASELAALLLRARVVEPDDAPPVPALKLQPVERVSATTAEHEVVLLPLGISGTAPPGFRVYQGAIVPLAMRSPDAFATVLYLPNPVSEPLPLPGQWSSSRQPTRSALGDAMVVDGQCPKAACRAYLVPVCDGRGRLVFVTASQSSASGLMDGWFRSFKWLPVPPSVCNGK